MTQSAWLDIIDDALDDAPTLQTAVEEHLTDEDVAAWSRDELTPNVEGLQRALLTRFRGRWPGAFHLATHDDGAPCVHLIGLSDEDVRQTRRHLRRKNKAQSGGPVGRLLRFLDTLLP